MNEWPRKELSSSFFSFLFLVLLRLQLLLQLDQLPRLDLVDKLVTLLEQLVVEFSTKRVKSWVPSLLLCHLNHLSESAHRLFATHFPGPILVVTLELHLLSSLWRSPLHLLMEQFQAQSFLQLLDFLNRHLGQLLLVLLPRLCLSCFHNVRTGIQFHFLVFWLVLINLLCFLIFITFI